MTENTRARVLKADERGIAEAGALLASGQLVAIPTETVYGLGGNARSAETVASIFSAKDRPRFNPLIVHVPDLEAARALAVFDAPGERLATAFWPGPLTLVLPLRSDAGLADLVTAGLQTVAIRVPEHPVARAVLRAAACPVAAPSANPSGGISPTTAQHVLAGLSGRISAVLDAGPCEVGLESTIVKPGDTSILLRPGGLPVEALEDCLGHPLAAADPDRQGITAPGQLSSHYAPSARVRLDAKTSRPGEVLLGFGKIAGDLTLSASGDLTEAAARLYACLRSLDDMKPAGIAVAPVPDTGLGRAINDRLRRAAAPRP